MQDRSAKGRDRKRLWSRRGRATADLVGRTLAKRYHVHAVIGSGGMGTIYGATDLVTHEPIAIKALHASTFTTSNLMRLRREAKICGNARSEHVCRVRHLGVDGGIPFIVMERLEGETVRQRLRRDGALSAADAFTITFQLLDALAACHAAGMIHRDVKPSNVYLTSAVGEPPRAKLIDFGLARPLPAREHLEPEEATITRIDVVPGTPHYLTPEQVAGESALDERVDVWGAGMTLYEMLTGRRAYEGPAVFEVLVQKILFDPVVPVTRFRSDVPPEIDDVIALALAKERRNRHASAAELRAALVDAWARHRARGIAKGTLLRHEPHRLAMEPRVPRMPLPSWTDDPPEIELLIQSDSR